MYSSQIFIKHASEHRVRAACRRITRYFAQLGRENPCFSVEEPDESNDYWFARGRFKSPDRYFLRTIEACLDESHCDVRILYTKKAYGRVEGAVAGNAHGIRLKGPTELVHQQTKRLSRTRAKPPAAQHVASRPVRGKPQLSIVH